MKNKSMMRCHVKILNDWGSVVAQAAPLGYVWLNLGPLLTICIKDLTMLWYND